MIKVAGERTERISLSTGGGDHGSWWSGAALSTAATIRLGALRRPEAAPRVDQEREWRLWGPSGSATGRT